MQSGNILLPHHEDLNKIRAEDVSSWLGKNYDFRSISNYLANKIIYPHTVAVNLSEMIYEVAILREMLGLHPNEYYSANLKRIYVPHNLVYFIPNIPKLVWLFIDVFKPIGLNTVILKGNSPLESAKNLGTFIKVEPVKKEGIVSVDISGEKYQVKIGSLVVLPALSNKVDIKVASNGAKILGKAKLEMEIAGGPLGVMVDAK